MKIAVDFDGTIVVDAYPEIGQERPFAIQTLKMLHSDGHELILWTVREGRRLKEAVEWCRERGVEFYAINRDFPEEDVQMKTFSRKIKADLFIDDRNIGGPIQWGEIYNMVKSNRVYSRPETLTLEEEIPKKKRRFGWF